jgi:hypothetical protein
MHPQDRNSSGGTRLRFAGEGLSQLARQISQRTETTGAWTPGRAGRVLEQLVAAGGPSSAAVIVIPLPRPPCRHVGLDSLQSGAGLL